MAAVVLALRLAVIVVALVSLYHCARSARTEPEGLALKGQTGILAMTTWSFVALMIELSKLGDASLPGVLRTIAAGCALVLTDWTMRQQGGTRV